jgi:hypothetical protein
MNEKQDIILSEIKTEENKKEVIIKRKIYIDCICNDIEHIGRIVLRKDINKEDNSFYFFMFLETNAKSFLKKFHIYNTDGFHKLTLPFHFLRFNILDLIERIRIILAIIFKDTVYMPLDWEIMNDTIPELADAIKKSYIDMNKVVPNKKEEK